MNKQQFSTMLKQKVLVLDGATGTELQKRGLPLGICPEQWVLDHPEVIVGIQRDYRAAGSDVVFTCTFGGNRVKLAEFGFADRTIEINKCLADLSRQAAGTDGLVAGDLAPTGQFVRPFGDMLFEAAVDIYKEQVRGLLDGGVDFFVIETMMDIQEARAALLAVRESCDLPVCVSMTFDQIGRTLTGTDPITALITLQALGADVVGCNCSTGPADMLRVINAMRPYAHIPLIAKPNAGLPKLSHNKTVFDMKPEEFGSFIPSFISAGVGLIGGCCGTSPKYIEQIRLHIAGLKPIPPASMSVFAITSARKTVFASPERPIVVIGERINPTGKKKLQEELKQGKTLQVRQFAQEQIEKGASVLDVNVGMPGIDECKTMVKIVELLVPLVDTPLCLDSASPEVLEAALRVYPGRALINSISGEHERITTLLPVAAKYGAAFVLLPLNDEGVPETASERFSIIENVFGEAQHYGYQKHDLVVDGLVMTVSSDQKAAQETLQVIAWCAGTFGCCSLVGLSNVSFGLPERGWVNAAFLAMAAAQGLTMVIANPSNDLLMQTKMASDVLTTRDRNSMQYIAFCTRTGESKPNDKAQKTALSASGQLTEIVLKGDRENIRSVLEAALREGLSPSDAVDKWLIPAIMQVGELFDKKLYYLPQLIQSAETMKVAFEYLEPLLAAGPASARKKATVVLATVKGDIHDIGKNIVGLMLKNYGFIVHDLGKDVAAEDIIRRASETNAEIVGLSALMTTTMVEMKKVIGLARSKGLASRFMIGGAVVNEQYAREIGADAYAGDAHAAVKLAERLVQEIVH
jgi:5-methyltetrahydrofolate--homocysteine methyltransferase